MVSLCMWQVCATVDLPLIVYRIFGGVLCMLGLSRRLIGLGPALQAVQIADRVSLALDGPYDLGMYLFALHTTA